MAKNNNLQDFIEDIADAIREKKGTEDKINPQDFANEIRDIHEEVDMLGFSKIGYTKENGGGIQEAIDYAYNVAKGWNNDGSTPQLFRGNKNLQVLPIVDWSNVTNASGAFQNDISLSFSPKIISFPNAKSLVETFNSTNILEICLDAPNATDIYGIIEKNTSIRKMSFTDSSKVTRWGYCFAYCTGLKEVLNMDFSNCNAFGSDCTRDTSNSIVKMQIFNLGKSACKLYHFSNTSWGTGSEENRQSLIDSLITYSYDRASAGMATATITLSANTKALLTEEEIAQITQKGYTIA